MSGDGFSADDSDPGGKDNGDDFSDDDLNDEDIDQDMDSGLSPRKAGADTSKRRKLNSLGTAAIDEINEGGDGQGPALTEEERQHRKKESNAIKKVKERQRRSKMSGSIHELRHMIPACREDPRANQAVVMMRAVEHIKRIETQLADTLDEVARLKAALALTNRATTTSNSPTPSSGFKTPRIESLAESKSSASESSESRRTRAGRASARSIAIDDPWDKVPTAPVLPPASKAPQPTPASKAPGNLLSAIDSTRSEPQVIGTSGKRPSDQKGAGNIRGQGDKYQAQASKSAAFQNLIVSEPDLDGDLYSLNDIEDVGEWPLFFRPNSGSSLSSNQHIELAETEPANLMSNTLGMGILQDYFDIASTDVSSQLYGMGSYGSVPPTPPSQQASRFGLFGQTQTPSNSQYRSGFL
jgi:hypothetical protein